MISKEEVLKIAQLARLELSEEEIKKMQNDMSAILDYFNLLKKAPKVTVEEHSGVQNKVRKDEAVPQLDTARDALLRSAPETQDRFIKVKQVLN